MKNPKTTVTRTGIVRHGDNVIGYCNPSSGMPGFYIIVATPTNENKEETIQGKKAALARLKESKGLK